MAGYSGTPLPKKLGIKEHTRVALLNVPAEIRSELKEPLSSCRILTDRGGSLDFIFLFVKSQSELKKQFSRLATHLVPAGTLWVAWPKKTSGVPSDLNENDVRRIGLEIGLVDVKVCAVSDVWSGLKFVIRVKDRVLRT
jgi:hypothetical protein